MNALITGAQRAVDWAWHTWHGRSQPVPPAQKSTINLEDWNPILFGVPSRAGEKVNLDTALGVATVLACVRVLAQGVAMSPLRVFRQEGERLVEAPDHPAYNVLHRQPNEWQTSYDWRLTMMAHAVLCGNAYSFKEVVPSTRRLRRLIPIDPRSVHVEQLRNFELVYRLHLPEGDKLILRRDQVFHIRGISWDGYRGLDIIQRAREAIGLTIATESSQAYLHGNGGRPSGILTTAEHLGPEAVNKIAEAWNQAHAGAGRMGTAVLDAGMNFQNLQMSGVDAQHVETRYLQIKEICRAFNVSPQMIFGDQATPTYASAEAFFRGHVVHTLEPWFENWRQRIDTDLLDGAGPVKAQFDASVFTKSNDKDRADFYLKMVQNGIMTPNEARRAEGLNPVDGGDELLKPLNIGKLGDDPDDGSEEETDDEM